jgi:hypothetical protein
MQPRLCRHLRGDALMAPRFGKVYATWLADRQISHAQLRILGALALNAYGDLTDMHAKVKVLLKDSAMTDARSQFFDEMDGLEALGWVRRWPVGRETHYEVFANRRLADETVEAEQIGPPGRTNHAEQTGPPRRTNQREETVHRDGPDKSTGMDLTSPPGWTHPPIEDSLKDLLKDEEEEPSSSSIGCADVFDVPAHRDAYLAYRGEHSMPDSLDAIVRSLHDRAAGGDSFDLRTIGQALLDMRGVGAKFSRLALAGFCRKLASAHRRPAPGGTSPEVDRSARKSEARPARGYRVMRTPAFRRFPRYSAPGTTPFTTPPFPK